MMAVSLSSLAGCVIYDPGPYPYYGPPPRVYYNPYAYGYYYPHHYSYYGYGYYGDDTGYSDYRSED